MKSTTKSTHTKAKQRNTFRRLASLLLVVSMMLSLCLTNAMADDANVHVVNVNAANGINSEIMNKTAADVNTADDSENTIPGNTNPENPNGNAANTANLGDESPGNSNGNAANTANPGDESPGNLNGNTVDTADPGKENPGNNGNSNENVGDEANSGNVNSGNVNSGNLNENTADLNGNSAHSDTVNANDENSENEVLTNEENPGDEIPATDANPITLSDLSFEVIMPLYTNYVPKLEKENGAAQGSPAYSLGIPDSGMKTKCSLKISLPKGTQEEMEVEYTSFQAANANQGGVSKKIKAGADGSVSISDWAYFIGKVRNWSKTMTIRIGSGVNQTSYEVAIKPFLTLRTLTVKTTSGTKNTRPLDADKVYPPVKFDYNMPMIGQTEFTTDVVKGATVKITPVAGAFSAFFTKPKMSVKINDTVVPGNMNYPYTAEGDAPAIVTIELSPEGIDGLEGFEPATYTLNLLTAEKDSFPVLGDLTVHNQTTGETVVNPKTGMELKGKINQFDNVTLHVEASGDTAGLTYEWLINNVLQKETGNTLTMDTSTAAMKNYECRVSQGVNGRIYTVSKLLSTVPVTIVKIDPPQYITQPQGGEYEAGSEAKPLLAKVKTEIGLQYQYQWYCNTQNSTTGGTPLGEGVKGSDGSRYYTPDVSHLGSYYYYLGVIASKDTVSSKESFSDVVTVRVNPLTNFLPGKGTEQEPYLIGNLEDLKTLKARVEKGISFANTCFKLTQDISLDSAWTPMGNTKDGTNDEKFGSNLNPFSGTFDGDNHTVTIPENGKPLFHYVREAVIKNLNIYGKKINGCGLIDKYTIDYGADGNYNTGVPKTVTIDHVTLKSGTSTLKSGFISGIGSGYNTTTVRNCTAEEGVIVGYNHDQASIGSFVGSFNGDMGNCVSYANVYGKDHVGGLVGSKGQAMGSCAVSNCEFYGTVTADGNWAGGILGAGYDGGGTAPNTPVATVKNCLAACNVTGKDMVGGITGGEPGCEDCWSNGNGTVSDNVFYGKLSANGKNVGGIVGFLKSFNKYQGLENNYYLNSCGAESGIGHIEHIITVHDPNYGDHGIDYEFAADKFCIPTTEQQMKDGSVTALLNKSETSLKNWIQGAAYPIHSNKPIPYGLTVTGNYKSEYYIGDALDLSGAVFTALWSDGKTTSPRLDEVKITGFDPNTRGVQTLTAVYGAAKAEFTVTVLKRPQIGANTITVSFTLLGDKVHDSTKDGKIHTLKGGNLATWIPRTQYTVDLNATVKDVFDKALAENGMTCANPSGNYVESITRKGVTLGEFTNGPLSGWMYTLNGKHPELGLAQQFLEDGDVIVWHYTDDYTKEQGSEDWNKPVIPETPGSTVIEQSSVISNGAATTVITEKAMSDAIAAALKKGHTTITIVPTGVNGAKSVSVSLPKTAVQSVVNDSDLSLVIKSDIGSVTIPNDTLASITAQALGGSILVTVAKKTAADVADKSIDTAGAVIMAVTITSDSKEITVFEGKKVTVSIPVDQTFTEGESYQVTEISDDGKTQTLNGKCVKTDGALTVLADTPHLSTFVAANKKIMPFTDVSGHWALEGIQYVYDNHLFAGTSDTTFSPNASMTRAMLVTVLYRMEGMPAITGTSSFTDVKTEQYYTDAVIWANAHRIAEGYENGLFGTNDSITRQQLASILHRYAQYKRRDGNPGKSTDLSGYTDAGSIREYALPALQWAVATDLISGTSVDTLSPAGTATRGQVATILMNYEKNVVTHNSSK